MGVRSVKSAVGQALHHGHIVVMDNLTAYEASSVRKSDPRATCRNGKDAGQGGALAKSAGRALGFCYLLETAVLIQKTDEYRCLCPLLGERFGHPSR